MADVLRASPSQGSNSSSPKEEKDAEKAILGEAKRLASCYGRATWICPGILVREGTQRAHVLAPGPAVRDSDRQVVASGG